MLSSYMLVGALLAMASQKLPFPGSGNSEEHPEHTYVITCDSNLDIKCKSPSLEQIAHKITENLLYNNIKINTTQLQLKTTATFQGFGLESLTISGDPDLNTNITCTESNIAGLVFSNMTRVTLQKLTVLHCGAFNRLQRFTYSSAVTILHSRDVMLSLIHI